MTRRDRWNHRPVPEEGALWPPCWRCKQSPCECEEPEEPRREPEGDGDELDLPEPAGCNW
jgi:hypothetical protein